jgi:H+-transporting ATPase
VHSDIQNMLNSIMSVLVAVSLVLVIVVSSLLWQEFTAATTLSFTVVLMVASIPLGIEIVTTATLAFGAKALCSEGAIVYRLAAIVDLACMSILCFDKTGTLTNNESKVQEESTVYLQGESHVSLLRYACMAVPWRAAPSEAGWNAVDASIAAAVDHNTLDNVSQIEFMPFTPITKLSRSTLLEVVHPCSSVCENDGANSSHDDAESSGESSGNVESKFGFDEAGIGSSYSKLPSGSSFNKHRFSVVKGAVNAVLQFIKENGNLSRRNFKELAARVKADVEAYSKRGMRVIAVAKSKNVQDVPRSPGFNSQGSEVWNLIGLLVFFDTPRYDTKETIASLRSLGVAVKMLSGDSAPVARETARVLGMGDYFKTASQLPRARVSPSSRTCTSRLPGTGAAGGLNQKCSVDHRDMMLAADGFAELLPEHKLLIVEQLQDMGFKVGMTGDGLNDVAALKQANIGIAVQGSTEAARAAADIVFTQQELGTIVKAVHTSRQIFVRIRNFLICRISTSLQLVMFFFVSVLSFPPQKYVPEDGNWHGDHRATAEPADSEHYTDEEYPELFMLPVMLIVLIAVLNNGTLITIAYDNVVSSDGPEKWNVPGMYLIAFVLAAVPACSSLLFLYASLTAWYDQSAFQRIGLRAVGYGEITTAMFLKVSVSSFLTLFSVRTGENWFFASPAPSYVLLSTCIVAFVVTTILSVYWPTSAPDDGPTRGLGWRDHFHLALYVWVYCIIGALVQDACKVFTYYLMKKFNLFNYNNTGSGAEILPPSTQLYIQTNKERDLASLDNDDTLDVAV